MAATCSRWSTRRGLRAEPEHLPPEPEHLREASAFLVWQDDGALEAVDGGTTASVAVVLDGKTLIYAAVGDSCGP